jgi:hypothetical protein
MTARRTTLRALIGLLAPLTVVAGLTPALADAAPAVADVSVVAQTGNAAQTRWELSASWTALAGATSYDVRVTDTPTGGHVYGSTTATTTTATVEAADLTPGAVYYVAVTGDVAGSGAGSAAFTAKRIDFTAPTGRFAFVSPTTAWTNGAESAVFFLRQQQLSDNVTRTRRIDVEVDPGDGTGPVAWADGADFEDAGVFDLAYRRAGTFHPTVLVTDAAGNTRTIALPTVTVRFDGVAPRITITAPAAARRHHVGAWQVLRGTAADPGSGQLFFVVAVWQQRQHRWYAYSFDTGRWQKGQRSLSATLESTPVGPMFQTASGPRSWRTPRIHGLTRGALHVRVFASDAAGNEVEVRHTERLTRR